MYTRTNFAYDWGYIPFWEQWELVLTVVLSAFLPVTPIWGVALQAAGMGIAGPLCCLYGRKRIKDKVMRYYDDAKKPHVLYVKTPPAQTFGFESEGFKAMLADLEIRWMALAMSAVGACTLAAAVADSNAFSRPDVLSVAVYALALAVAVALRVSGLVWWACLMPLPALAYLLPAYRWFFPRSGLRGAERRAAIAAMPARFEADIRTSAQKALDEKREKRRLREERRLANIRRSRR